MRARASPSPVCKDPSGEKCTLRNPGAVPETPVSEKVPSGRIKKDDHLAPKVSCVDTFLGICLCTRLNSC